MQNNTFAPNNETCAASFRVQLSSQLKMIENYCYIEHNDEKYPFDLRTSYNM
eukprot:GAHX01002517.1.p2 GENE.GAHX01002517.1~~GAHX01002517.1.p2  ORF type:complete len:52 (-),score=1.77 GAHX01002517.1:253-408(-)